MSGRFLHRRSPGTGLQGLGSWRGGVEQSMKYDDELFLLLLGVFVIIGVALLLAFLF